MISPRIARQGLMKAVQSKRIKVRGTRVIQAYSDVVRGGEIFIC